MALSSSGSIVSDKNSTEAEERCFKTIAESAPPLFENGKIVLQTYHIGWIVSGLFTLVAVVVSFWLISKHLQWYTNKREQRYIIRLLFMVPLYAVISFASFIFWNHSTPIILIRDAYEAIVLTAFFYLLLVYLSHNPEEQKRIFLRAGLSVAADKAALNRGNDVEKWAFPFRFVKWKPKDGLYFLQLMKWGVLQYCVIRPTSTLAAVILNYMGLYCEDSWGLGWGHIYITIIMSVSVTVAMYCLLQLYFPVAKDLAPHQPLLKLFSVKAVVFLTFWQATFLSLLSMFGVVKDTKYMTADDVNNAIGAILETFEMMVFAFLHIRAFTYKPYSQPSKEGFYPSQTPQWRSLAHAMDFRETFQEIWLGCIYMFDSIRGKEPTPDFGVIREAHYEGAFGKQRPLQGRAHQSPAQDCVVRVADFTYPTVEIEVDKEVEVIINGRREWLLPENPDPGRYYPVREKSEGLQDQIDRELARRGYAHYEEDSPKSNCASTTNAQPTTVRRSWWRNIYNRISQTGHEPEEGEKEPFRQSNMPRLRSHRHHRNSTVRTFDLDDQPPKGLLNPLNTRSPDRLLYEEYNEAVQPHHPYTNGGDHLLLPTHDLRCGDQLKHHNRPAVEPTSPPHASRRALLSPQLDSSALTVMFDGDSGPYYGPMSSSRAPLNNETTVMAGRPLSAPQFALPSKALGQKLDVQHDRGGQDTYSEFPWSSTFSPNDSLAVPGSSPSTQYERKSVHRREGAAIPQRSGDQRVRAWIHSMQTHHPGL